MAPGAVFYLAIGGCLCNEHSILQKEGKKSLFLSQTQDIDPWFNSDLGAKGSTDKDDKELDPIIMAINRQSPMQLEKNSILLRTRSTLLEIILIVLTLLKNDHLKILMS